MMIVTYKKNLGICKKPKNRKSSSKLEEMLHLYVAEVFP